ncbi:MAG: hypothetical protein LBC97_12780 [Bifidobacteriaceae bacterium]|nr:hypothetical protein [Bifidobacteriaceae bacterium]
MLSFYRERESHRVVFSEDAPANRIVSCGPLWAGHVCDDHDVWVNLFEPAVAARLIQAAVEMPTVRDLDGWQLLSGLTPAEFPASDS